MTIWEWELGRVENQKSWNLYYIQAGFNVAHKNKHTHDVLHYENHQFLIRKSQNMGLIGFEPENQVFSSQNPSILNFMTTF